jgi:hypothetical protein
VKVAASIDDAALGERDVHAASEPVLEIADLARRIDQSGVERVDRDVSQGRRLEGEGRVQRIICDESCDVFVSGASLRGASLDVQLEKVKRSAGTKLSEGETVRYTGVTTVLRDSPASRSVAVVIRDATVWGIGQQAATAEEPHRDSSTTSARQDEHVETASSEPDQEHDPSALTRCDVKGSVIFMRWKECIARGGRPEELALHPIVDAGDSGRRPWRPSSASISQNSQNSKRETCIYGVGDRLIRASSRSNCPEKRGAPSANQR